MNRRTAGLNEGQKGRLCEYSETSRIFTDWNYNDELKKSQQQRDGLSQAQFAALIGVSVHTLQEWEQGQPSGAAKTLLKVTERYPQILREVAEA